MQGVTSKSRSSASQYQLILVTIFQLFEALIDFGENWDDRSLALLAGGNLLRVLRQVGHCCGDNGDDNHGDDNRGDEVVNNNDNKNENRLRPLRKKEMAPVTILGWKGWRRGFVDHDHGFLT